MADIHPCPLCGKHYFGFYVTAIHLEQDHANPTLAHQLVMSQKEIEQQVTTFARALEEWDDTPS